jgi:pimeloyl-ACP methyl ester carboxylesterase
VFPTQLPETRRVEISEGFEISFRLLKRGARKAVVLIHGNLSSSLVWEDFMTKVPEDFDVVAPDLRGFGDSGRKPVDATRGLRDFSDDVLGLLAAAQVRFLRVGRA